MTANIPKFDTIDNIKKAQNYLFSLQQNDGHWCAYLESNVTITAEAVLLYKIWGVDNQKPLHKIEHYLRSQQRNHGGWELYYGDGGDLSTSVEAYMALRLLGVSIDDNALIKAKKFILSKGGISKTRIFTKFHLALIGCYDWRGVPSIPPWIMLLPQNPFFTIYEMSSWARGSTVPLLIVFDQKPIFAIEPRIKLNELYSEGINNVKYEMPSNGDWTDIFGQLDNLFKLAEEWNIVPFKEQSIQAAEKWIIERQEVSGDWGGIIPAMLNSLLALKTLKYHRNDPIVTRGLNAVENFAIETHDDYLVQACVSPVWDTAWSLRALVESGVTPNHPNLIKGGEWLLNKQILDYGDWGVKNPEGKPGGWAFEYENRFYPDMDDSAVIVMTLNQLELPNETLKREAIFRCLRWIETMQCYNHGWAAFDINNDANWLNFLPYADLKAMIDPATADITARVLEMVGSCDLSIKGNKIQNAIAFLIKQQEEDGSWFGRWGVNYIYGTSGVLSALAVIAPQTHKNNIEKAINWLVSCQNSDGGWGETCDSYKNSFLKGKGDSTPSQTAWALIGLLDGGNAINKFAENSINQGINYLLSTQNDIGTWEEKQFTGTGFPGHFYINYHLYRHYFPLIALGKYAKFYLT
ncbi:MAG: squalene--hopene cyclase [Cyanobacteria bacterium]|nr:squalene--hopene cyclase [Cyanobacteria bacterium CG_2015-16_32_12]NCO77688.1 squalene--hopene cyclase [Cyanobacteria bacterium CG_2015-22_32_23]NCQ05168.1 squalene--hopene cyclase [Cyanobacteria bacterium CG_2015-09_32_10]NCQ41307.1 squalene--hopene cyclase [Cyanobacteria bacterium CG_2015-04_32_10]NCS83645.1 squalene--hopene cyclase [Cyanobacteria bacterium CG_2015-02_32_10]